MSDLINKIDLCLVNAMTIEKTITLEGGYFIFPGLITKEQAEEIKSYITKKTGWIVNYKTIEPFGEKNDFRQYQFAIFSPENQE